VDACYNSWGDVARNVACWDAYASILRVKYILDGQDVEICHQMIRHGNALDACIGRLSKPGNFQERLVSHA